MYRKVLYGVEFSLFSVVIVVTVLESVFGPDRVCLVLHTGGTALVNGCGRVTYSEREKV